MNRILWTCATLSLFAVSVIAGCAHHRQGADVCGEGCCGDCEYMISEPIHGYSPSNSDLAMPAGTDGVNPYHPAPAEVPPMDANGSGTH